MIYQLSDERLLKAYDHAVELKLEKEFMFIDMLEKEMKQRNLLQPNK